MRRSTRLVGFFAAIAAATASVAACSLIDTSDLTGGIVTNDARAADATNDTSMPANDAATMPDGAAADAEMDATDAALDANDGATADDAAMDAADAADAYDANSALPPYVQAVLDDQPTAYWRFEEPPLIGSIAYSTVNGSTYDGVYSSGITANHGRGAPGALGADGGTSIVQVSGNAGGITTGKYFPLAANTSVTFELLMCANAVPAVQTVEFPELFGGGLNGSEYILAYDRQTDASAPQLIFTNGSLSVFLHTTTAPTIGEWMHLVLEVTGGQVTVYQNSFFGGTAAYNARSADAGTLPFTIGSDAMGNNLFSGSIDEFAVYETALPPERINAHYMLVPTVATNHCTILDGGAPH